MLRHGEISVWRTLCWVAAVVCVLGGAMAVAGSLPQEWAVGLEEEGRLECVGDAARGDVAQAGVEQAGGGDEVEGVLAEPAREWRGQSGVVEAARVAAAPVGESWVCLGAGPPVGGGDEITHHHPHRSSSSLLRRSRTSQNSLYLTPTRQSAPNLRSDEWRSGVAAAQPRAAVRRHAPARAPPGV